MKNRSRNGLPGSWENKKTKKEARPAGGKSAGLVFILLIQKLNQMLLASS